jgi:hypothetical protein
VAVAPAFRHTSSRRDLGAPALWHVHVQCDVPKFSLPDAGGDIDLLSVFDPLSVTISPNPTSSPSHQIRSHTHSLARSLTHSQAWTFSACISLALTLTAAARTPQPAHLEPAISSQQQQQRGLPLLEASQSFAASQPSAQAVKDHYVRALLFGGASGGQQGGGAAATGPRPAAVTSNNAPHASASANTTAVTGTSAPLASAPAAVAAPTVSTGAWEQMCAFDWNLGLSVADVALHLMGAQPPPGSPASPGHWHAFLLADHATPGHHQR